MMLETSITIYLRHEKVSESLKIFPTPSNFNEAFRSHFTACAVGRSRIPTPLPPPPPPPLEN